MHCRLYKARFIILISTFLFLGVYFSFIHFSKERLSRGLTKIVTRYENGITKERYYTAVDSQGQAAKHGRYILKYPNGQVEHACDYAFGKIIGREIFFHKTGKIKKEVLYDKDGNFLFEITY